LEDGIDPLVLEAVRWKRPVKHDIHFAYARARVSFNAA
jgi:hypothetical protein